MNSDHIPIEALRLAAGTKTSGEKQPAHPRNRKPGMGDFMQPFISAIRPATSMPIPAGPADFPTQQIPGPIETDSQKLDEIIRLLRICAEQLIRQNSAANPVIRSVAATQTGGTMDWSQFGEFDRLMIINLGPDAVWLQFDQNGPAVLVGVSDNAFELTPNMSVNITHSVFDKIGLKCDIGKTATVQAIAWQTPAGNLNGAID